MSHRAEQIIDAVVALLQASPSIGVSPENIFAHRSLSLSEDQGEMPAITVNIGEDSPVSDQGNDNLAFIDSLLTVEIVGYFIAPDEADVKRELFRQRRYAHVALLADPTLGLPFVMGTQYGGASKPEIDSSTQQCAGSLEAPWRVPYRMNIADPGD